MGRSRCGDDRPRPPILVSREQKKVRRLLFLILVDRGLESATITSTCRNKLQASNTTIPVPLGELFKHRPLLAVISRFRVDSPMLTAVDQMPHAVLLVLLQKRTKRELNTSDLTGEQVDAEWLSLLCPGSGAGVRAQSNPGANLQYRYGSPPGPMAASRLRRTVAARTSTNRSEVDGALRTLTKGSLGLGPYRG